LSFGIENVAAGFSLRRPKLSANPPDISRVEEKTPAIISDFMFEYLWAGSARPGKTFM